MCSSDLAAKGQAGDAFGSTNRKGTRDLRPRWAVPKCRSDLVSRPLVLLVLGSALAGAFLASHFSFCGPKTSCATGSSALAPPIRNGFSASSSDSCNSVTDYFTRKRRGNLQLIQMCFMNYKLRSLL